MWAGVSGRAVAWVFVAGLACGLVTTSAWPDESKPTHGAGKARVDLDGDPLPAGAVMRLGIKRLGQAGRVHVVAFLPNGKIRAALVKDGQVSLWDVADGKKIGQWPGRAAALSPTGTMLATFDWEKGNAILRLWDVASGKEVRQLRCRQRIITSLAFSPDGTLLAVGGGGPNPEEGIGGTVAFWDVAPGQLVREVGAPPGLIARLGSVAFSPDGKLLAALTHGNAHGDGGVFVWEVASGARFTVPGQSDDSTALAFSPDGKTLAIKDLVGIVLWRLGAAKPVRCVIDERVCRGALTFSPDGRVLAGGLGAQVWLWEVASGKPRLVLAEPGNSPVEIISWSQDGRLLASGHANGTVLVWDRFAGALSEAVPLSRETLEQLWGELASENAEQAYRALTRLVQGGEQTVRLLRQRLQPLPQVDVKRVAVLIAQLRSKHLDEREHALKELEKLGPRLEGTLRKALAAHPDEEVKQRLEYLLERIAVGLLAGEELRQCRALEVLELLGTESARSLLTELAQGTAGDWLAGQAQATLQRLARHRKSP